MAFLLFFCVLALLGIGVVKLLSNAAIGEQIIRSGMLPSGVSVLIGMVVIGFQLAIYGHYVAFPLAGWAVWGLFITLGWAWIFRQSRDWQIWLMILVLGSSFGVEAWRANGFVQSFNIFVLVVIQVVLLLQLQTGQWLTSLTQLVGDSLSLIPKFTMTGLAFVFMPGEWLAKVKGGTFTNWLKSGLIALLTGIFFLVLFSNADPVFASLVKDFVAQLWERSFTSAILVGFMVVIFWQSSAGQLDQKSDRQLFSRQDMLAALSVLSLVIGGFLLIQFQYLFGGSKALLAELNLTYSEYVRKGFTELLFAALVGGILVYVAARVDRISKLERKFFRKLVRYFGVVVIVELAMVLVSALKRDMIYVETYGLTRVRLIGGMFLAWLAGFLILLLVFLIWKKWRESNLLASLMILSACLWGVINLTNVDQVIAHQYPGHHDYVDYFYLSQLSEDAAESWPSLVDQMDQELSILLSKQSLDEKEVWQLTGIKLALHSINSKGADLLLYFGDESEKLMATSIVKNRRYSSSVINRYKHNSWRHWNLSKQRGYSIFQSTPMLDRVSTLIDKIEQYQTERQLSLASQERKLLFEFEYPFINVNIPGYQIN